MIKYASIKVLARKKVVIVAGPKKLITRYARLKKSTAVIVACVNDNSSLMSVRISCIIITRAKRMLVTSIAVNDCLVSKSIEKSIKRAKPAICNALNLMIRIGEPKTIYKHYAFLPFMSGIS